MSVAVTRARAQASGLARRLQELGASVIQAPVIRIEQLPGPALDPSPYDLICLASPNARRGAVRAARRRHPPRGDARALAHARVAAIGPGTARALAEHGVVADVVPERSVAESLVAGAGRAAGERALVARAREARDVLPDALRARGAEVDVLALYETVAEPLSPRALQALREADYVTFTSSSTVRFFVEAAGDGAGAVRRDADRFDRPGHQRGAARARAGARHRGRATHDVEGMIDAAARRRGSTGKRWPIEPTPVITFLSDYGLLDEFVGVCHGVMARRCPSRA